MTNKPAYEAHRIGTPDGRLPSVLAHILVGFAERHGHLPAALVVNKALVADAQEALADKWPGLKVETTGGCLAWECWLKVPSSREFSDEG